MKTRNNYPEVELWNKEVAPENQLKIINKVDFPKRAILEGLGIEESGLTKSFGIINPEEIQSRLALSNFLMRNPALRRRIKKITESRVPQEGSDFLAYFHKDKVHNSQWNQVLSFIEGIRKTKIALPKRLVQVVNGIKAKLMLEESERALGTKVSELLEKSTVVEGHITFTMENHSPSVNEIKDEKSERRKVACINGHRHYSASLSRVKAREHKDWDGRSELKSLCFIWLLKNFIAFCANFYRKCSMKTMTIKDIDSKMMEEIEKAVNNELWKIDLHDTIGALPRSVKQTKIDVYFCYNQSGLQIRIDAIRPEASDEETDKSLEYGTYDGYSFRRVKKIKRLQKKINGYRRKSAQYLLAGTLYKNLLGKAPAFFDLKEYTSPIMDEEFRHFAVSKALNAGDFKAKFDEIIEHRDFFYSHMQTLRQLCDIIESMQRKAKSAKTKLCIPEILQGQKQTLIMDGIYPIHLFARKDVKPRPILGINEVNGEMVSLTGENASGKTVAELALTDNIWLAQSGLPVFGNSLAFTIKKTIGLVFIERGDGSTCELLMRKIKNLLSHLETNGGEDTLFILDELGTGTSEGDFIELGKQILRRLDASNASVIYSTQIKTLAEYAQKTFGTRCLQLDRATHRISEGIGDANPQGLADEVGLSAYLSQN